MANTSFHTTFSTSQFWLSRTVNGSESGLRSAVSYRFGFNGKEMDNEISGQTGTNTGLIRKNDLYYVDENTVITIGFYRVFKNGISKITEKDIRIALDGEINVSSEEHDKNPYPSDSVGPVQNK